MGSSLEDKKYSSLESFLNDHSINEYHNMIRSTLKGLQIFFKRDISQIRTNTFNPWIARTLNSNMDLQFIINEYSCASYVLDCINKSNRGISNLHRELLKLSGHNPELTSEQILKKLRSKILNIVEMSAQEASWFILMMKMSNSSRSTVFIPTCWPFERQKAVKRRVELGRLEAESTDLWQKSIMESYESRPDSLSSICLADYVSLHHKSSYPVDPEATLSGDDDYDQMPQSYCSPRRMARVIRYRNYSPEDKENFKREMVLLYFPFRSGLKDILDGKKFLLIYNEQFDTILSKRSEYERCDVAELRKVCESSGNDPESDKSVNHDSHPSASVQMQSSCHQSKTKQNDAKRAAIISVATKRKDVMSKEEFCQEMRTSNPRQRELLLEIIHRIHICSGWQMEILFTGPAGSDETFVLKLIMEIFNRFAGDLNQENAAYVACASTGKAAANLGGATVHSTFHLAQSRKDASVSQESLHNFRILFGRVRSIIIDEISMISSDILHRVNIASSK